MNAAEQRTHRTVTQSLEARIEALEALVEQLGKNDEYLKRQGEIALDSVTRISQAPLSARLRWLFGI